MNCPVAAGKNATNTNIASTPAHKYQSFPDDGSSGRLKTNASADAASVGDSPVLGVNVIGFLYWGISIRSLVKAMEAGITMPFRPSAGFGPLGNTGANYEHTFDRHANR